MNTEEEDFFKKEEENLKQMLFDDESFYEDESENDPYYTTALHQNETKRNQSAYSGFENVLTQGCIEHANQPNLPNYLRNPPKETDGRNK